MKEPFKRGSMNFEDYNYNQSNKYILVDPNFHADDTAYVSDPELSQFTDEMGKQAPIKKGAKMQDEQAQDENPPLTEKELEKSIQNDNRYMHRELDVETESERLQKLGEINARRAEELERRAQEEAERNALEESKEQEKDQKTEDEYGAEAAEEEDEIEYEIFYNRLEIKETLRNQKKDAF